MSFTSPRYSFLAAGGALVLATVGMPVSAAGGAAYVWPLMVTQPMAVNFYTGTNSLSATCSVTQNGSVIATGSAQAPYARSSTPGGSVTMGLTVSPTQQSLVKQPNGLYTAPILLGGAKVTCVVTVVGSNPKATGQSTLTLPAIFAPVAPMGPGHAAPARPPSSVTMPNISISMR